MKTQDIIHQLESAFDEGRSISPELRAQALNIPEARRVLEELDAMQEAIEQEPMAVPSEAFAQRLHSAVHQAVEEQLTPVAHRAPRVYVLEWAVGIAAVVILFGMMALFQQGTPSDSGTGTVATTAPVEKDSNVAVVSVPLPHLRLGTESLRPRRALELKGQRMADSAGRLLALPVDLLPNLAYVPQTEPTPSGKAG